MTPPYRKILLVDNFDSFVYNLAQYIGELGAEPVVVRNDAISFDRLESEPPDAIVISPGPGRPEQAGASCEVIARFGPEIPILGVCLGHQCLAQVYGATITHAATIMHGKTSLVSHTGEGIFEHLPNPLKVTRYHSLAVAAASVPSDLEVTASTDDGTIMGLRHRSHPVTGVQFHPESVFTESGHQLLENFLAGRL